MATAKIKKSSNEEIVNLIVNEKLAIIPTVSNGGKSTCKGVLWSTMDVGYGAMELLDLMDEHQTENLCVICGKRSGGLMVLDIDVKYKKGFDVDFFEAIKENEILRDVFGSMRVERTPSGGYHLMYKVGGVKEIPDGIKVSKRYATEDELLVNKKEKTKCFLETLGEGDLCKTFPSPGYVLIKEGGAIENELDGISASVGIPTITIHQHESIIKFCQLFNEVPDGEEKKAKEKVDRIASDNGWYLDDCTPIKDFNKSEEASNVLIYYVGGWEFVMTSGNYDLYKKTGRNKWDIGATFHRNARVFIFHTTNVEFPLKSYSPAGLIGIIKFGGNKDELRSWLVAKGYGRLKPGVEKSQIRKAARIGIEPPKNISEEGKVEYEKQKVKYKNKYPYGLFWEEDDKGNIKISQKGIDRVVIELGFRFSVNKVYQIDSGGWLLKEKTEGELYHAILKYIGYIDEVECGLDDIDASDTDDAIKAKKVYDEYSRHIKSYGELTIARLMEFGKIDDSLVLKSEKNISYKFYKNCYLTITGKYGDDKGEIIECDYSNIGNKFVFEKNMLDRVYKKPEGNSETWMKCKYWEFLELAIHGGMSDFVMELIGYLTHDFIDNSMNAIIIAMAANRDSKKGSGSGKNAFFNLLNHATTVHVIDGAQVDLSNAVLQSFNYERVLVISDVEENFNYKFFKNFSSGSSGLKKLYHDVVVLKRKLMPKPVILTNYSYVDDAGLGRRIVPLEFSEFFSKLTGGIFEHFKCMFPALERDDLGGWTEFDWNCFDYIIAMCIRRFLDVGELVAKELSVGGWEKQFIQEFKEPTLQFIEENFERWCNDNLGRVSTHDFDKTYKDFFEANGMNYDKYKKSSTTLNKALENYCGHRNVRFLKNIGWKMNGIEYKGRIFGDQYVVGGFRVEALVEKEPF